VRAKTLPTKHTVESFDTVNNINCRFRRREGFVANSDTSGFLKKADCRCPGIASIGLMDLIGPGAAGFALLLTSE
jgi:hypothetical protein